MHAATVHYLLNVSGIPLGAGGVSSPLGGWIVVAALLVSAIILSACVDRNARLAWPERRFRWVTTSRIEQVFWGFRVRCAGVDLRNT
jgi:hypothetical protein